MPVKKRVIIMGAGGRDYHNFNMVFKENEEYEVVAFTASQIPGIENNRYPAELAGPRYPYGIPIYPEDQLPRLVKELKVDEVILAYSDLTYEELGSKIAMVLATGASFKILGPAETMLNSIKPVIAVTAVKTGAGKSTVSRALVKEFKSRGIRVVAIRHPMAYGDLVKKNLIVIRSKDDIAKYPLTVEEREEYEPYIKLGIPILAGIDYGLVLREAEKLGDIILWDGGNNDWPFIRPNYMITVADALRPGLEVSAFPGEVNIRMADTVIITKVSEGGPNNAKIVAENVKRVNPSAKIVMADLEVRVENPKLIEGKRVVVIEDSPTVTHGGAPYAAGYVAAKKYGAEIIDPKPYAKGIVKKMYEEYPHMGPIVPTTGYNSEQLRDLEETINSIPADAVILATPAALEEMIRINKPYVKVTYELVVRDGPSIREIVDEFMEKASRELY
ncbi:MAG: cyclic 2,3-diphosphoglycerate synthase [Pyrodictiaceae archaeon]